jgi:hypothetical protein
MKRWQIFTLILFLTTTLAFPALIWPAFAQDRPCLADAQRLCKDLAPDDRGRMMQCLKDHETSLSDACKARMQTFAHEPCAEDAGKLCKDVEPGNKLQMVHCLKEHETDLSEACKGRLHSFWGRML